MDAAVVVWLAWVDAIDPGRLAELREWLTEDERARHLRFVTDALRREHLVTRALARWALSEAEPGVAPEAWRFARDEAGKPFVCGPMAAPAFSLAHAAGLVACAVAPGLTAVGVDVEPEARGEDLLAIADEIFAPPERARLAGLDAAARRRHAVELWTSKEAYLKALGGGISLRLRRLDLTSSAVIRGRQLEGHVKRTPPTRWQIEIGAARTHIVAVAVPGGHGVRIQDAADNLRARP